MAYRKIARRIIPEGYRSRSRYELRPAGYSIADIAVGLHIGRQRLLDMFSGKKVMPGCIERQLLGFNDKKRVYPEQRRLKRLVAGCGRSLKSFSHYIGYSPFELTCILDGQQKMSKDFSAFIERRIIVIQKGPEYEKKRKSVAACVVCPVPSVHYCRKICGVKKFHGLQEDQKDAYNHP